MAATEIISAFSYACDTISAKLSRGERVLLQDVSFSLSSGERLAVIGETGSGKTMLALSILGLLPANVRMQGGCIQMDGTALPTGKQLQTRLEIRVFKLRKTVRCFSGLRVRCRRSSITAGKNNASRIRSFHSLRRKSCVWRGLTGRRTYWTSIRSSFPAVWRSV